MASTRILISRRANVTDASNQAQISDPDRLRQLDGLVYKDDLISHYISDEQLNDLEISGGEITLVFVPASQQLRVSSEFTASRELGQEELDKLRQETEGQWCDGIGEDPSAIFPSVDKSIQLDFCFGDEDTQIEQLVESKKKRPRRTLARAAQKGDIELIRKALAAGEDINSQLGGVDALNLAIMGGHVDAAVFLVEQGAGVGPPQGGGSPLLTCVLWLAEPDALRLAAAILAKGGAEEISTAYDKATERWKMELAKLLVEHGADPHHREKEVQKDIERRRIEGMKRAKRNRPY